MQYVYEVSVISSETGLKLTIIAANTLGSTGWVVFPAMLSVYSNSSSDFLVW